MTPSYASERLPFQCFFVVYMVEQSSSAFRAKPGHTRAGLRRAQIALDRIRTPDETLGAAVVGLTATARQVYPYRFAVSECHDRIDPELAALLWTKLIEGAGDVHHIFINGSK